MKLLCLFAASAVVAGSAVAAPHTSAPIRPQQEDLGQRIDANQISMVVTNVGSFAYDITFGTAGLEYPRGSGKTAVYSAGLWIGALVDGQPRGAVAEYDQEYVPGVVGADPASPDFRVFKLLRHYATLPEAAAALADYNTYARPYGAPDVQMLADGSLDVPGDQMLWSVFNDADPFHHYNEAGRTAPLGVEVQQTTWAYDRPGALGQAVILGFHLTNRSGAVLQDAHVALWVDPDLGKYTDDLVGCDVARDLGYCYNGSSSDSIYGANPPAVGIELIRGPAAAVGDTLPMTAFAEYTNGGDPLAFQETWNLMHGLARNGSPVFNPSTGLPTPFMFSGDPVTGIGWLDLAPADQRMLLSSGPFTLAPGESEDILAAVVVGQGISRLASISALRDNADAVRELLRPSPPTPTLLSLVSADAAPGRVVLRWHSAGGVPSATLERREEGGEWLAIASLTADGTGHLGYDDLEVVAGRRYGYRLAYAGAGGGVITGGETWVDIPAAMLALALEGFRPNPAGLDPVAWFTLPDEAAARLEVLDVSGRRVFVREVGSLGAGRHALPLGAAGLGAGVYVIRLSRGERTITARAAVVR
jgi:hypothetical protein